MITERRSRELSLLTFDEKKSIGALSFLCSLGKGIIDHYFAAKLMYLFDRAMLLRTGTPAFFGNYYALPWGPIVSQVNDGIKSCNPMGEERSRNWSDYFSLDQNSHKVTFSDQTNAERYENLLSGEEENVLTDIYNELSRLTRPQLVSYIQNLPEHISVKSGRKDMSYEFVLRANGFSEEETKEIIDELEYEDEFRALSLN